MNLESYSAAQANTHKHTYTHAHTYTRIRAHNSWAIYEFGAVCGGAGVHAQHSLTITNTRTHTKTHMHTHTHEYVLTSAGQFMNLELYAAAQAYLNKAPDDADVKALSAASVSMDDSSLDKSWHMYECDMAHV